MREKFRSLIILLLTLILVFPTVKRSSYKADNSLPEVYFIGSGYTDVYPNEKDGKTYYMIQHNGGYVGETLAKSTYDYIDTWKDYTYTNAIKIPETVGVYKVEGIEDIQPLQINSAFPFSGQTITFEDIKEVTDNSTCVPKENTKFSSDGSPVLVYTNTDGSITKYEDKVIYRDRFTFSASDYSIRYTFDSASRILALNCTTSWTCKNSEQNRLGAPWGSLVNLKPVADDASEIVTAMTLHNDKNLYPTSLDLKNYFNLNYIPTVTSDLSLFSCYARYYDFNSATANVKSSMSGANNKASWYRYWSSYLVPGGLDGHEMDAQFSWDRLWDGTYFDYIPASGQNLRVYQPYVIKLKVSTRGLDLAVKESSQAYFDKGFLYLKPIAQATTLADDVDGVDMPLKITISNKSGSNLNAYSGLLSSQKLETDKETEYIKEGSTLSTISTHLNGSIEKVSNYLRVPVTISEETQTLIITYEINEDHDPEEITYKNNIWSKEIEIVGAAPDLSAEHILYNITGNNIGSRATVSLDLITGDADFDSLLGYVSTYPKTTVLYRVYLDDKIIKLDTYQHPLLSNIFRQTFTFYTSTLTEEKPTCRVKVDLIINPNKNLPEVEKTFDNNSITREFLITATQIIDIEPDQEVLPPVPDYPDIPKFTNMEQCIFVDKNNPNSDSKMLFTGGCFNVTYTASTGMDVAMAHPTGTELSWIVDSSSDVGTISDTNWGLPKSYYYTPAFPQYGKDGWCCLEEPWDGKGCCENCEYIDDMYDIAEVLLTEQQHTAFFTCWNPGAFQQSGGAIKEECITSGIPLYRVEKRTVSNSIPCYGNCCYGDTKPNHIPYVAEELHQHVIEKETYKDKHGKEKEREVEKCVGESPKHYHSHTEFRIMRLASIDVQYNINITGASTTTVDYGTGDKITRSGYGIATILNGISYESDLKPASSTADFGVFKPKSIDYEVIVKTPATNKRKPFLVSKLEELGGKYVGMKNPASIMGYRETFIDVDYPDGEFPVLYQVLFKVNNFEPFPSSVLPTAQANILNKYGGRLQSGLGVCKSDYITVKGNMWNDSWTHPATQIDNDVKTK